MFDPNIVGVFAVLAALGICVLQSMFEAKPKDLTVTPILSTLKNASGSKISGYNCFYCGGVADRINDKEVLCPYCGRITENKINLLTG